MVRLSYPTYIVTDFRVMPPSFGLCYSWDICVSVRKCVRHYHTLTPMYG